MTNESADRRKIHALVIQKNSLKAEVERLNELICPHRQSRCVDCIENAKNFECECGNKYNSEFFNARTFNCFNCGMSITIV